MKLITFAAAFEVVTGLILIAFPSWLAWLLLGSHLAAPGEAVGRVAGIALLALGLSRPLQGLLAYNVLIAIFLLYLGIRGELVGVLLWPAFAVHGVLSALLARLAYTSDVSKTI